MKEIKMFIPRMGYRIETRKKTIDRDVAPSVLTPSRQRKITCAARNENDVTITKHVIVCLACGRETPAYAEFAGNEAGDFESKSRSEIEEWTTRQLSLFGEQPRSIAFNSPVEMKMRFVCPHCGAALNKSRDDLQAIIRSGGEKIKIMRALSMGDLLSLRWVGKIEAEEFDLFETITFNLKRGRVYVSVESEAGKKCAVRDISNIDARYMSADPVVELIHKYKQIYRGLQRFFKKFWNGTLPFPSCQLNLEKYILLTRFVGFGGDFYNALPFVDQTACIEKSFAKAASRLHRASRVPAVFRMSQLPDMGDIKRIVFSNPEILLYQKELESLWEILEDSELFCALLGFRNLYEILLTIHVYPCISAFLKEYVCVAGKQEVYDCLSERFSSLRDYALAYNALSDYRKKIERKKWAGSFLDLGNPDWEISERLPCSIPIFPSAKGKGNFQRQIGGYSFVRLCNTKERDDAIRELGISYYLAYAGDNRDFYGVMKNSKYVDMIMIENDKIDEAWKRTGKKEPDLFLAICEWEKQCGIRD